MDGLWEEYSIHGDIEFGIRKVVYPDGQQFTNEVFRWGWIKNSAYEYKMVRNQELLKMGWKKGWNAIGEETYAIQNKSIPYLLGDNEIKEYRFVREDGLFNVIDLGRNDIEEILRSSPGFSLSSHMPYDWNLTIGRFLMKQFLKLIENM